MGFSVFHIESRDFQGLIRQSLHWPLEKLQGSLHCWEHSACCQCHRAQADSLSDLQHSGPTHWLDDLSGEVELVRSIVMPLKEVQKLVCTRFSDNR